MRDVQGRWDVFSSLFPSDLSHPGAQLPAEKKSQAKAIMSCSISDCRFAIIIIIIKRPLLSILWNKNSKFQLIKFYEQQ